METTEYQTYYIIQAQGKESLERPLKKWHETATGHIA
jgi:hypothetical protein